MKLTICICTIPGREDGLKALNAELARQVKEAGAEGAVEIMYLGDNRYISLGLKRRRMVELASGEYVCFIDDDDEISPLYVRSILKASELGLDVITFNSRVSGVFDGIEYSAVFDLRLDENRDDHEARVYYRIPNHLCPIKKTCYENIIYPDVRWGEDAAIAPMVKNACKSYAHIDDVLYHYKYSASGSACPVPQ